MQTFDYEVNDVMEHIIQKKVDEISLMMVRTFDKERSHYSRFAFNLYKWRSSHERAKAVVLALPRNDAEVEGFINGLFTTAGDPT